MSRVKIEEDYIPDRVKTICDVCGHTEEIDFIFLCSKLWAERWHVFGHPQLGVFDVCKENCFALWGDDRALALKISERSLVKLWIDRRRLKKPPQSNP